MGKPGSGYMISAPGAPNIRMEKNMVGLPPGQMTMVSGCTSTPWRRLQVARDRLAQRQDALRRRVAVMAVAQRLDGGLDDVGRRLEVRLADAEVDDGLALALQRVGARQHLEGGLRAQALEVGYELQHGVSSKALPDLVSSSVVVQIGSISIWSLVS